MENTGELQNISAGRLINLAAEEIRRSGSETPKLDALVLLEDILGKSRGKQPGVEMSKSWITAHPEFTPEKQEVRDFLHAVNRRKTGLPVAYITGRKFFWKYEFKVTEDVLIPKPDTELLVERTEEIIQTFFREEKETAGSVSLLDMCTGSGCVAVSLKADFPRLSVTAADISRPALDVAQKNAVKILSQTAGSGPPFYRNISFIQCDLREGIPGNKWNIITANPPYVPADVTRKLLSDGRNEPRLALDGGEDGLELVKPLVYNSAGVLARGGFLLVETGEYNADKAAEYFQRAGFTDIFIHRDLAGEKRLVEGRINGN